MSEQSALDYQVSIHSKDCASRLTGEQCDCIQPKAAAELSQLEDTIALDGKEIAMAHNALTEAGVVPGILPERIAKLHDELLEAVKMVALAVGDNEHGWKKEHVAILHEFLGEHLDVLTGDGA
jgi:hypothetical protein